MAKDRELPRIPAGDLLVVAPERLDDACFSVPATRAMAAHAKVHTLTVLSTDEQAALWKTVHAVETISFPEAARPAVIAETVVDEGGKFAAALAWEPGRTAVALKSLALRRIFGPAKTAVHRGFLATSVARSPGPVQHRVQDFLQFAKGLGAEPFDSSHFAPVDLGLAETAPAIALVPDSDFGASSHWRGPSWSAVGGKIVERHGLRPTIVGPGPAATSLAEELGDNAILEQPESLEERIELLARHAVVIACDGSSVHLASHVGATCVVLFGPNDPNWRRPLGTRHVLLHRHVECAPCLLTDCPLDHRCMAALDSDQVVDVIGPLLRAAR